MKQDTNYTENDKKPIVRTDSSRSSSTNNRPPRVNSETRRTSGTRTGNSNTRNTNSAGGGFANRDGNRSFNGDRRPSTGSTANNRGSSDRRPSAPREGGTSADGSRQSRPRPRPEGGGGFANRDGNRSFGGGDRRPSTNNGSGFDRRPSAPREGGGFNRDSRPARPEGGASADGSRQSRPRPRPEGGGGFANRDGNRSFGGGDRRPSTNNGSGFDRRPSAPREGGGFNKDSRPANVDNRDNRNFGDEKKKFNQDDRLNNFDRNTNIANEDIRIHKLLAELGISSRRGIENLIETGKILVNGKIAILGQKINLSDDVSVNGHKVNLHAKEWIKPRIIMYHKTSGEIVSHSDPEGRPSVFEHLPRIRNGKWIAIGRLDFNTEGLLLFTNNGDLANKFMHPSFGVEREYAVRVLGILEPETQAQLLKGILLDDGLANFSKIEDAGGENLNHWYKVTISEGRNREVRRMFEAVGLTVSRLTRVRYGTLSLSSRLQRGKYQELSADDVKIVLESFGIYNL